MGTKFTLFQALLLFVLIVALGSFLNNYIWGIILLAVVGFVCYYIYVALRMEKNSKPIKSEPAPTLNQVSTSEKFIDAHIPYINTPLLSTSISIYLLDIFSQIESIRNNCLSELQHSVKKVADPSIVEEKFQLAILHDVCQLPIALEIDMLSPTTERNIMLVAFAYFKLPKDDYNNLVVDQIGLDKILREFLSLMNTHYTYETEDNLLGTQYFKNYRQHYTKKLLEIVTLVTTIDFNLSTNENKVIERFKGLSF